MIISGFQKSSLIDYPGEICSIIFTQGCNFRCAYCHNPELVEPCEAPDLIDVDSILRHVEMRKDLVQAVTITGGEPTIQHDLIEFVEKLKSIGVKVKLDSNGTNPKMIGQLIDRKLIDYIAMDIKAPIDKYEAIIERSVIAQNILKSIDLIMGSGINYEFRTTIIRPLLSMTDFDQIGVMIKGAELYILQQFHKTKTLRLDGQDEVDLQYSIEELRMIQKNMCSYVRCCEIRE